MRLHNGTLAALIAFNVVIRGTLAADASTTQPDSWCQKIDFALANGIAVTVLNVPDGQAFSTLTYLPYGYTGDDADHAFWRRLISRLNAETGGTAEATVVADHVRVESWSWPDEWEKVISEQATILAGVSFTDDQVAALREDSVAYVVWAETHEPLHYREERRDFEEVPLAVFAQARRHGARRVNIDTGLQRADAGSVRQYCSEHWGLCQGSRVMIAGKVDLVRLRPFLESKLGILSVKPVSSVAGPRPARIDVAADLKFSYLVLAMPASTDDARERAAIYLGRCLLHRMWAKGMDFSTTAWLTSRVRLRLPEDKLLTFVLVDPATAGGDVAELERSFRGVLHTLAEGSGSIALLDEARHDASRLAASPRPKIPDTTQFSPRDIIRSEIETYRDWADDEWSFEGKGAAICEALKTVDSDEIRRVIRKYSFEKNLVVCRIHPAGASSR